MIPTRKKRIEFIDLAKGVCILLITISHCGVNIPIYGLVPSLMPLFFLLSGMFFKDYGKLSDFLLNKINKLLIPFLFFYIISYIPFYILKIYKPELLVTEASGICDVFNNRQFFNGPIWFLLALFWANLVFYFVYSNTKQELKRCFIIILIGIIGIVLGKNLIFIPCFFDVAMTALPYYYIGYIIGKQHIENVHLKKKWSIIIITCCYLIVCSICINFNSPYISFHYNKIPNHIVLSYLVALGCIIVVLILCKMINKLPFISYCGRYSIILLCLHHMVYRPLKLLINQFELSEQNEAVIVAIATIIVCSTMIPLCTRYIPWFTSQKDLIKFSKLQNSIL